MMKEILVIEQRHTTIDVYTGKDCVDIEIQDNDGENGGLISLNRKEVKKLIRGLEKTLVSKDEEVLKGTTIFTDGGYSMKEGKGGWAFIVVEDDKVVVENFGRSVDTTNNVMEMTAFYNALRYVSETHLVNNVTIISDSQYIVKGFNEWMHSWVKKDWQGTNGEVKNKELWQEIYTFKDIGIKVEWVKAHNAKYGSIKSYYNDIVDKLTRD